MALASITALNYSVLVIDLSRLSVCTGRNVQQDKTGDIKEQFTARQRGG
jgi:hypothetical protein